MIDNFTNSIYTNQVETIEILSMKKSKNIIDNQLECMYNN